MNKYIKCFSQNKANELIDLGFNFLYKQNDVWYFENDTKLLKVMKFNNNENFNDNDIFVCKSLNF